jgi:DNA-binding transcriptional LysR family regulator
VLHQIIHLAVVVVMRLFVRIAETGSLSAAAQSLAVSQPTASRQLKQLEQMLGVQLVRRSTHDLGLTDAGKRFFEDARALLAGWEASIDRLRNAREELTGLIRVAVPVALGQTILATIASRFLVRHPGVTIDWRLIDQPGDLVAGGYDLWIRAGPVRQLGLIVRHLWQIERTIVAMPSFRLVSNPKALERQRAVRLFTFVPDEVPMTGPRNRTVTLRVKPAFDTDNIYACDRSRTRGRWLRRPALLADPTRPRLRPADRNLPRLAPAPANAVGRLPALALSPGPHQRLCRLSADRAAQGRRRHHRDRV